MKLVHGWMFPEADEFMASEIQPDGRYQAKHLDAALAYVTDWRLAIDGGAHVGTWSRTLSQRFDKVLAFEPSIDTYDALFANMMAFGCENVGTSQCALGATIGRVHMAPLDPKAEAMKNTGARFIGEGGSIPRLTIDSFKLPALGFLKLDVEGSEMDALKGAERTLKACRPIVLFEDKGFWRRYGYVKEAPQQFLTSIGYRQLTKVGTDAIWGPS